ncbi:hypothetical protein F5050DRAFT_1330587 [Lentinula boryana]|uniref:Uncharacterized protein n=1 Tax=Lentinula boryana TaxID=40481 RepID=A0ABQ8QSV7_9AGAR|nr:hypothetical protein F5050DRAFT_1330587 [Lentinula boryana]
MSQTNSSESHPHLFYCMKIGMTIHTFLYQQTPSRTSQVPRTPSKVRLDAIEEALAEKKSDPRANGNNQFTTPSSRIRAQKIKTPGQLKRDEEIRRAVEPPSQSTHQSNDANVFQSSQPPPSNYKLTPLSQESINHSDEDDFFAALPLTPPTTQRIKRSRDHDSDEESEPDYRNSPSKNKGKKKATVAHDSITPTTSANDVTDTFSAPASLKLSGIIDSLEEFRGQVAKLERQIKALKKSNEAKLEKIQNLETNNHALKSENDECVLVLMIKITMSKSNINKQTTRENPSVGGYLMLGFPSARALVYANFACMYFMANCQSA